MLLNARNFFSLALAMCLFAAGCQSSAPQKDAGPTPIAEPSRLRTDPSTLTDPCAENLQSLCETMLLYYTVNKHLPATLPELQPYADGGTQLAFSCPTSGDPYVYKPAGLIAPNIHDRLVLYDAKPVHNGHRWAIVMTPASPPNPVTMFVIPLNESLLNAYLQGSK